MLQVTSKSPRLAHIQDERSENPPLDGRSVIQFADIQVPDSTVAETNSELRIWHCTPGTGHQLLLPGRLITLEHSIHRGRRGTLLSLEYTFTPNMNLPSFPIALLPKPPSVGLRNGSHIHCRSTSRSTASDQGTRYNK